MKKQASIQDTFRSKMSEPQIPGLNCPGPKCPRPKGPRPGSQVLNSLSKISTLNFKALTRTLLDILLTRLLLLSWLPVISYPGHFVPSFLVISYPVTTISYPGHFVPILVISYLGQLGRKLLYGGQFVPKSFRTIFCHFVPILVISYPAKMDGLTNGRTDRHVLIEMSN